MSRPGNPDAAEPGQARQYRAPAGLLEKLMAAVRPEFRAEDLVFDPRDPVFGGPPCAVSGCDRPHRRQGLCTSHWQRWRASGRPALAEFTATAEPGWHGHLPLDSCVIAGCNYGAMGRGMCQRHFASGIARDARTWPPGRRQAAPLPPGGPPPACRIGYCSPVGPRHVGVLLRPRHPVEGQRASRYRRVRRLLREPGSRPGAHRPAAAARRAPAGDAVRPAVPRRRAGRETAAAEMSTRSSRSWPPRARPPCWTSPRNGGPPSIAPRNGRGWRPFILDARRRVEALAFGAGWDTEYPRDTWRLRNLGIDQPEATISFAGIPQPWLKDLAKRYTRWQLATGLSRQHGRVRGPGRDPVRRLARLPARPARRAGRRDPPAAGTLPGRPAGGNGRPGAPRPLRRRAERLPEGGPPARLGRHAAGHRGDLPRGLPARGARLPRGLAAHVMAQVEQPANLAGRTTPPTG